jgi:hypothetical protein
MRWTEIVNESAHEGWVQIQSAIPDVTGDDTQAAMDQYGATELVSQTPADPGDSFSRDIYTYMNPEKTIKVVLYPSYDPGNGGYHLVSVYKREGVEEMQEEASEDFSVSLPDRIVDYWTKQEITGPERDRRMANIQRIIANEPVTDEATHNAVAFRVGVLAGIHKPLRG